MEMFLKIDDDLKNRIQHIAGIRQRLAHRIMREAIQQYVEREEARESFKQEALASWTAYQETGRHVTGLEVRTSLNTWGTYGEKAPGRSACCRAEAPVPFSDVEVLVEKRQERA